MLTERVDGTVVRRLRERKGLTVKEVHESLLSQGVNVRRGHIYNIELGNCQPSAKVLVAIAKAMNCDQDELFVQKSDAA